MNEIDWMEDGPTIVGEWAGLDIVISDAREITVSVDDWQREAPDLDTAKWMGWAYAEGLTRAED